MKPTTAKDIKDSAEEPEICIWIDKYDDVFSDFDSRPFAERTLSDDFLREVRKMTSEKLNGDIRLKFNLFDDQRNCDSEAIISGNLKNYFNHIAGSLKNKRKQILHKGYMLLGSGFILISLIFLLTTISEEQAFLHGIILMLEPIGWFLTWTGLDHVFQTARKDQSAIEFNLKMARSEISFYAPLSALLAAPSAFCFCCFCSFSF